MSVIDTTTRSDKAAMLRGLKLVTGASTVPQVFVGGKSVGGCDDTLAGLRSGWLLKQIKELIG